MAFPTGWGRKCAVTISSTYVSGTSHTDFPVLITEDMLPSEMFDADGTYPALSGGGDIRFSSDSAGTTQLACEIVSFVTDNNPANGSAEIWVKVPTLSGSTDTTIYVWYDKTAESQPAVTDTYGRDAVWSDYAGVWHGGSSTDSSGNGNTLTYNGTVSDGSGDGPFGGNSWDFSGSTSNYLSCSAPLTATPLTMSIWGKPDTATANHSALTLHKNPAVLANQFRLRFSGATSGDPITAITAEENTFAAANSSSGYSTSSWTLAHAKYASSTSRDAFANGGSKGSNTTSLTPVGINQLDIGRGYNISSVIETFDGKLAEARLIGSALTDDWIATEYNNQNSPGTFASAGTPESVGGGTTITADFISPTTSAYEPTITTGAVTISADFVSAATSVYEPTVTAPSGAQDITADFISSATSVHEPTVTTGAVSIAADFISASTAVHEPTLTTGAVTISADFVSAATNVYEPTVFSGSAIVPEFIAATTSVYEPTVTTGAVTIAADLIAAGTIVYEPSVSSAVNISADFIAAATSVYEPTVGVGAVTITADFISAGTIVYEPSIPFGQIISADFIAAISAVYEPNVFDASTIWTEIPDVSTTWTTLSDTSTVWTEI